MIRTWAALVLAAALLPFPARAEWQSGGGAEVELEGDGNSWVVEATINGSFEGRFLLDTGASICVLDPAVARRLDLEPTGEEQRLLTANGEVSAPVVRIRSLEIGRHRARDVLAVVHRGVPPPLAGIIGLSYLNNFHYSVDARRRKLRFK